MRELNDHELDLVSGGGWWQNVVHAAENAWNGANNFANGNWGVDTSLGELAVIGGALTGPIGWGVAAGLFATGFVGGMVSQHQA